MALAACPSSKTRSPPHPCPCPHFGPNSLAHRCASKVVTARVGLPRPYPPGFYVSTSDRSSYPFNSICPASESFEAPDVLRLYMLQHIPVAIRHSHAKIGLAGRIPPVFHFRNFQRFFPKLQSHRPLVHLVPRIALHLHSLHHTLAHT